MIWAVAGAAVACAAVLARRMVRSVRRVLDRMADLLDDWAGVPGRPGVMLRMRAIEGRLGSVEHVLRAHCGQSLRDAVDRVSACTRALTTGTDTI